jgi:sugar/nucleoside kinase (ribokinase family)
VALARAFGCKPSVDVDAVQNPIVYIAGCVSPMDAPKLSILSKSTPSLDCSTYVGTHEHGQLTSHVGITKSQAFQFRNTCGCLNNESRLDTLLRAHKWTACLLQLEVSIEIVKKVVKLSQLLGIPVILNAAPSPLAIPPEDPFWTDSVFEYVFVNEFEYKEIIQSGIVIRTKWMVITFGPKGVEITENSNNNSLLSTDDDDGDVVSITTTITTAAAAATITDAGSTQSSSTLIPSGKSAFYPSIPSRHTLDTTGAGDVFIGYLISTRNVKCALMAAAMCVEVIGTEGAIPWREQVDKRLEELERDTDQVDKEKGSSSTVSFIMH